MNNSKNGPINSWFLYNPYYLFPFLSHIPIPCLIRFSIFKYFLKFISYSIICIPPSTHQSKINGSNAYNQSNYQKSGYNNNISQKGNDSFPTSKMPGKNIAKTAMPENPFGFNQKGSQLPMLAEKIMKSNA